MRRSWALIALVTALFAGCAHRPANRESTSSRAWLSDPRPVRVEILVTVQVSDVLSGEALAAENRRLGIPEETPPTLMLWSSDLRSHMGQEVSSAEYSPPPTEIATDPENGNRLLLWDLSRDLQAGRTYTIRRVYEMTLNSFNPPPPTGEGAYDPADPQVAFYTKSEPFLELTDEIRNTADTVVDGEQNPWEKARLLFRFVRGHMTYVYPPPGGRGASVALREGRGDCGQYADLFIALCRGVGVPARFVGGFNLGDSSVGSHAWAEVLLPSGEWVPIDPTGEEDRFFGRCLVNTHVTASLGRNIPLPRAPAWAKSAFSDVENGRTDFMQTLTELKTGIRASVDIQRRVLPPR
jgi:transglutaminase-like putative cysteine protease